MHLSPKRLGRSCCFAAKALFIVFISLPFLFSLFLEYIMSDYLCEELIVEIFTRLPPKSLLRFRSLSKSLYSCIPSPDFIRIHTFRSPQKLLFRHQQRYEYRDLLCSDDFYTLHSEDQLPLCPTRGYNGITPLTFPCTRNFSIIGSYNGIFCLSEHKGISLWNPSIRRKLTLPDCPRRSRIPWEGLGFGFDLVTDDYKIVSISDTGESSYFYAVKTGTWCAVASPTPLFSKWALQSCFLNGVLHWVVYSYQSESHDIDIPCIMTFDLSTHVFGMIPLPYPFWRGTGLTSLQGSLAVISTDFDDLNSWIWVRRDDSWSVVFKSIANQFKGGFITGVWQPTTNEDLLVTAMMDRADAYNYITKSGVKLRVEDFRAAFLIYKIFHCVESLHLLDMETACEANQVSVCEANQLSVCEANQQSVSGVKKTSTIRYLIDLLYYFKNSFNLRR